MENTLSLEVQMQFLRPGQLEAACRRFPVVYVPFGLIEWHGPHLPLGNDALKAHAILIKCAEKFGGIVYPPIYFHSGFNQEYLVHVLTELFDRLKRTGFRVILGVSGHNTKGQIDMINKALAPVIADGTVTGMGLWEVSLSKGPESGTDHAAKWETSNMMFFYPDLVDMSKLGDESSNEEIRSMGPITPLSNEEIRSMKPIKPLKKMKPFNPVIMPFAKNVAGKPKIGMVQKTILGIGGLDPRKHASSNIGKRNVELASESIGKKAQELLASLSERSFNLEALEPRKWWMI